MITLKDNVNYISPEVFQKILDYVKSNMSDRKLSYYHIQMIFKIAYNSGLRVNEVLKLKPKDFDFDLLEINLGQTKTEQRGLASITPSFKPELETWIKSFIPDVKLFPITRQAAYNWLMEIGRALSISALITPQTETNEKTKTHIFRKSIGKYMLYKQAPLNIIQRKLRHTSINMTSEYLKIKLNDVKTWESDNL